MLRDQRRRDGDSSDVASASRLDFSLVAFSKWGLDMLGNFLTTPMFGTKVLLGQRQCCSTALVSFKVSGAAVAAPLVDVPLGGDGGDSSAIDLISIHSILLYGTGSHSSHFPLGFKSQKRDFHTSMTWD